MKPIAFAGLALGTLLLVACSGEQPTSGQAGMPPAPVTITRVSATDVEHYADYAGRVQGAREVEIRARVSGILQERLFAEGEAVVAGQTLFQIEPGVYQTALRTAQAELADARAHQAQAAREWQRVAGLFERQAVSERERDQAQAGREAADARLARARAALEDAERNLRYTRVEAPVSGMAGMEAVTEGNLIEPGARLTVITQHDPVHVHFSLPEPEALSLRALHSAQQTQQIPAWIASDRYGQGGSRLAGALNFTDSRVDMHTGSVAARAQFANPDGQLLPGQFVRVRVLLNRYSGVFVIDPAAVGEGPQGPQVFVLGDDDSAQARPVQLGPIVDGQQVILAGLADGERLVINGQVALRPGAPTLVVAQVGAEG